jgi:hypothetical protein
VGRFFAVDPLAYQYIYNSPYAFAENKVIAFIELEGLEIALPRIGPVTLPRPILTIPRAPAIPIPIPPSLPAPPVVLEPTINQNPAYPTAPAKPLNYESDIDWNNSPTSPDDLDESWEDVTPDGMRENTNSREFKNKDTGREIRWDPGEKGKSGWKGKNHWHRYNPNRTGDHNKYLDRFGNPVANGSKASHIGAGESFLLAIPGLIEDVNNQINELQKQRGKLSIFNPKDWKAIKSIWNKIDTLEDYKDNLQDYKDAWDKYEEDMDDYYKKCNNCIL